MYADTTIEVVDLLEQLLLDTFSIDAPDVQTHEVLTKGGEPGVVYRFDAHGTRYLWACGPMRPSGHPAEVPVLAIYLEAGIFHIPTSWDLLLRLLEQRFPALGGRKIEILDQGDIVLGVSILLPLGTCAPGEVTKNITAFLRDVVAPSRTAILELYPDLQPVVVDT